MSDLPLRPELVGRSPYGAPQIDVPIRLNTNENPYPPPPEMIADIAARIARISIATPIGTRSACGPRFRRVSRRPDRRAVVGGPGVGGQRINEILQQILQAFGGPGRTALGFQPGYDARD